MIFYGDMIIQMILHDGTKNKKIIIFNLEFPWEEISWDCQGGIKSNHWGSKTRQTKYKYDYENYDII